MSILKKLAKEWDILAIVIGLGVVSYFTNRSWATLAMAFSLGYFLLLGVLMASLYIKHLNKESQVGGYCPQCDNTGFERWFFDIEIRHGSNHIKHPPWMRVERQIGFYPCERCNSADYATFISAVEKNNKIKEFLEK